MYIKKEIVRKVKSIRHGDDNIEMPWKSKQAHGHGIGMRAAEAVEFIAIWESIHEKYLISLRGLKGMTEDARGVAGMLPLTL